MELSSALRQRSVGPSQGLRGPDSSAEEGLNGDGGKEDGTGHGKNKHFGKVGRAALSRRPGQSLWSVGTQPLFPFYGQWVWWKGP